MKMIGLMPAAMLALVCIACNDTRTASHKSSQSNQPQDMSRQNNANPHPTSPRIVPDEGKKTEAPPPVSMKLEERNIGTVNQEGIRDNSLIAPPVSNAGKGIVEAPKKFDREDYDHIVDNAFQGVQQHPLSTFSIDVDEAAYSNIRRFIQNGSLPPAGAVRIEEMINYFDYNYPQPTGTDPFSVNTELAACPWSPKHQLVHIGLQGRQVAAQNLPPANLVFLIDVSGSMDEPNKLPLVKASLKLLAGQLREVDKVAIVVYAGNAGLVLPSTSGSNKTAIKEAIDNLEAGGSTAGGQGIELAYKIALQNFRPGANNRVILATDGDFNVGESSDDAMVSLIEQKRNSGIFLSVLGFGTGNYQDNKMQQLADKGNGNHFYIDNFNEARKVLQKEFGSTLYTIAKDVKIQVEFNPRKVQGYRLIGYENRVLAAEDFNDDAKDAGELGAGHTVTALYEIIPAGLKDSFSTAVDPLKYQQAPALADPAEEMLTIKLRYKKPDENTSSLITKTVGDVNSVQDHASGNFRFSAAVAEFGMLLRNSPYKQQASMQQVLTLAGSAVGRDADGYRREFVHLAESAGAIFTVRK